MTGVFPDDLFWLAAGSVVGAVVGLLAARRATGSWHRPVAIALACAHLGAVLGVTLFPLPLDGLDPFTAPYSSLQLEPFATIGLLFQGPQSIRQLGGNLVLLAPMGILVPIAWRAARPVHRTLLWGLLASVTIELLQFTFGVMAGEFYRVVDVDDVLLNTLGVAVGRVVFGLGWWVWRVLSRVRPGRR